MKNLDTVHVFYVELNDYAFQQYKKYILEGLMKRAVNMDAPIIPLQNYPAY